MRACFSKGWQGLQWGQLHSLTHTRVFAHFEEFCFSFKRESRLMRTARRGANSKVSSCLHWEGGQGHRAVSLCSGRTKPLKNPTACTIPQDSTAPSQLQHRWESRGPRRASLKGWWPVPYCSVTYYKAISTGNGELSLHELAVHAPGPACTCACLS